MVGGLAEEIQLPHEFILVCFKCTVVIYESVLGFGKYMPTYLGVKRHHVCNVLSNGSEKNYIHIYITYYIYSFYSKNKA